MQCYGTVCTRCSGDRMKPEIDCSFFLGALSSCMNDTICYFCKESLHLLYSNT